MKTFNEIIKEIKTLSAPNNETQARSEKEAARLDFIANPKSDAARAEWQKALDKYATICKTITDNKIKIELLKGNACIALAAETIPVICEIWNKYAGKKHGPKTSDKIKEEIKNRANVFCYLSQGVYSGSEFCVSPHVGGGWCNGYNITISTVYDGEKKEYKKAVDGSNVIQTIAPEDLQLIYISREYIEDIDGAIAQLYALNEKARAAQENLENIVHEYNKITRGSIKTLNARENITQWII